MPFKLGEKIWRFDPMTRPFVSDKYPIPLNLWQLGVSRLDATFKAPNGHIYFFYDQVYWRFDERKFKVALIKLHLVPQYFRIFRMKVLTGLI